MTKLIVEGLEVYGYHGATKIDREIGARYRIDLELFVEETAQETDSLADSVDLIAVIKSVSSTVSETHVKTLERLASYGLEVILNEFEMVDEAFIKLTRLKMAGPETLAGICVQMSMRR